MGHNTSQIYDFNVSLFHATGIEYQSWEHEPILDYETDERLTQQYGWTAAPTKSLFLKLKGGAHALLLTHKEARLDSKAIKQLLGKRPSVCTNEEMIEKIGCVPGAVCPFGLPEEITLIIDPVLQQYPELMFTPGKPEFTFSFASQDLAQLVSGLDNTVVYLPES